RVTPPAGASAAAGRPCVPSGRSGTGGPRRGRLPGDPAGGAPPWGHDGARTPVPRLGGMPSVSLARGLGLPLALVGLVVPLLVDVPGLEEPGERMLGIFAMAIVLFVTEAIPLVATAVLIILLEVLLL